MSDESILRLKAREAMEAGKLPQRRPKRMWGGPGIGAPCVVCSTPVQRDELGFELEFAPDEEEPSEGGCHVHLRCFAAWEFERRNGAQTAGPEQPAHSGTDISMSSNQILPAASKDGTIYASYEGTVPACERDKQHQRGPIR